MRFLLETPVAHFLIDIDVLSETIARDIFNKIGYKILENDVNLEIVKEESNIVYKIFWNDKIYTFHDMEETKKFIKRNVYHSYKFNEKEIETAIKKEGFYCKVYGFSHINNIHLL